MSINLSEKQLKAIAEEANKQIHKHFPLLHNAVEWTQLPYVFEAYNKIMRRK